MSPTSRRHVLRSALASSPLVVGTGCVSSPRRSSTGTRTTASPTADSTEGRTSGTNSPTSTGSGAVTPDPDDPIAIVFSNESTEAVTVSFAVTDDGGGDVFSEGTVRLSPGDRSSVDSGIDRPGEYAVHVDVAGGSRESAGLPVEEYDVRMGSNLIAIVDDEGIEFLLEE